MDAIVAAVRSDLLFYLIYSIARSFIFESTGASFTRGDTKDADQQKLNAMRAIWREPSLRLIGMVSAFSLFLIVPYVLYRDWFARALLELVAIAIGTPVGIWLYRSNVLNNMLTRATTPPTFVVACYFILR